MAWIDAALFAVLCGTCVLLAVAPASAARRRSRGDRLAQRYRMHVWASAVTSFDERLDRLRRRRFLSLAAATAVAGAVVVALDASGSPHGDLGVFVMVSLVFLAAWLGTALAEVDVQLRRSGPRSARTRSVAVIDFVHPAARALFASLTVVSTTVAVLAARGSSFHTEGAIMLALVTPVLFLGCETFARVVAHVPQPAATPEELYVHDALRSDSLTNLYLLGIAASTSCVAGALSGFTDEHALLFSDAVLVVGVLGTGVLAKRTGLSYLRFRSQLWPDLAAEAVVPLAGTAA